MKEYIQNWTKSRIFTAIALSFLCSVSAFSPHKAFADAKEIRAYAWQCDLADGSWKRVRSGIYSCRYGYRNYQVYNFKVGSVNVCYDGRCRTEMFRTRDKGSGRREK